MLIAVALLFKYINSLLRADKRGTIWCAMAYSCYYYLALLVQSNTSISNLCYDHSDFSTVALDIYKVHICCFCSTKKQIKRTLHRIY